MTEVVHGEGFDISFETRVAEERKGVRQRALAIRALFALSAEFGGEPNQSQIEAIRAKSKKEAIVARKGFEFALKEAVKLAPSASEKAHSNVVPLHLVESFEQEEVNDHNEVRELAAEPSVELIVEVAEETQSQEDEAQEQQEAASDEPVSQIDDENNSEEVGVENEPLAEKQIEENESFNSKAVAFLKTINLYDATLTAEDIPIIIEEISQYIPVNASLDYKEIIKRFLEGDQPELIADDLGSTKSSITQTINNFKNRIVRLQEKSTKPETAVIEAPVSIDENTIEDDVKKKPETHVTDAELERACRQVYDAMSAPKSVEQADWLRAAEVAVTNYAIRAGCTNEQATSLWTYLHRDKKGLYGKATPVVDEVIDMLQEPVRESLDKRTDTRVTDRSIVYRAAILNFDKKQSLDTVYNALKKFYPATTEVIAERRIVYEFSTLLKHIASAA